MPFAGVDENNADVLAQLLAIELANSGKYVVISRTSTIEKAMEEQNIQRSGLTDASTVSKLGEAINAQYVLSGEVASFGSDELMFVEIINVLNLEVKDGADVEYKTIGEGVELMSELSYDLTGVKSGSNTAEIEIETVLVESGSFNMGSNDGEADEKPVHIVTLTENYYIGKYEVTQKQWLKVMGNNPSHFRGENRPVEKVRWYDAVEFCNKLSKLEGLDPYYSISGEVSILDKKGKGYRLPTEAEWEYAAREERLGIIV